MASKKFQKVMKRSALSLALGLCFAAGVNAQSNTSGSVVVQANAGDTVIVENAATGFKREVTVGADGSARLSALPIGSYTITRGSDKRTANVNVGTSANINFAAATTLSTIEVVGAGMVNPIDVSSVESSTIMTEAVIDRLPIARNVTSVALLAPGTVQGDATFGNLASFGGSTVGENAYFINGFNVTNFRTGLGFSNVPFEMYQEFQTKTGGYGAEFGRSTGGVVNAITKRGSNEFHFGASAYWNPEGLQGQDPDTYDNLGVQSVEADSDENSAWSTNLYASGAIVKDRLFFYAIATLRDSQRTNNGVSSGATTDVASDSPFYGLKLDWQINDDHRIEYTGFQDENETLTTGVRSWVPAEDDPGDPLLLAGYNGPIGTATKTGGVNHILRYSGYLTDTFSMSLLAGRGQYETSQYNAGGSAAPGCLWMSYDTLSSASRQIGCSTLSLDNADNKDVRKAYRVDFEWDLGELFMGSHFLRFGMDRENNESSTANSIANGASYRYIIQQRGAVSGTNPQGVWRFYRDYYNNVGNFNTTSSAIYLEDQWSITDNLLLNLGVRNEAFDNRNAADVSFIKIDDQLAPRLGFAWDVKGDSTMKVFGNYGRYHLPVAANTNVRLAGAETYTREYFQWTPGNFAADGSPVPGAPIASFVFADGSVHPTASTVDANIKPMYQDEMILGFQKQLGENWAVGVRAAYRELKSTIEDVAIDAALNDYAAANGYDDFEATGFNYYVLTNPGFDMQVSIDMDGDGDLEVVDLTAEELGYPKSVRKYKALEFFFERSWDGTWFLQGSYTWSKSYGNNEGFVRSDNGQTDAGLTTLFDQPGLLDGAYGNLPNDRRHQLKVFGAYQISDEWQINANLLAKSGRPINCFGNHPTDDFAAAYDTESFYCNGVLVPRGSLGTTGWVYNVDFGVAYRPSWADDKLGFKLDITNVFNEHDVTEVYEIGELPFEIGVVDDNFLTPTAYQDPRSVRFSVSYDW